MDSLRRHPRLGHFSAAHLDLLESCTRAIRVPAGTVLIAAEAAEREAYFLQAGSVEVRRSTSYGDVVLTRLVTGDMVGELAFIDHAPRSGDVIAISELDLRVLDPEAVDRAAGRDPTFEVALYWTLWKSLARKLRTTNSKLVGFFRPTAGAPPPAARLDPPELVHVSLEQRQRAFRDLGLTNMEINYLASLAEGWRLAPRQKLIQDGERGDHLYAVLEGRVMVSKVIPEAGEEALAFLERGEVFGEMALIDDSPRCADVSAADEGAIVLGVRREVFAKILDLERSSSIRVLRFLCRHLARRLRDANEKLVGWYILAGGSGGDHR